MKKYGDAHRTSAVGKYCTDTSFFVFLCRAQPNTCSAWEAAGIDGFLQQEDHSLQELSQSSFSRQLGGLGVRSIPGGLARCWDSLRKHCFAVIASAFSLVEAVALM